MYLAVWPVPVRRLPADRLPPGVRPLTVAGRGVVVTFWVDYRPGGVLAYRELLVAVAVRHGRRIACTAVSVWVDDERSMAGGRELWGIPKDLGTFTFDVTAPAGGRRRSRGGTVRTRLRTGDADGPAVATGTFRDLLRLPGRWPVRSHLVQRRSDGRVCEVPLRLTGTVSPGRARLSVPPTGPLAHLHGRRPLLALALRDFRFTVGR
ncbi:acetoacetate decarboxylase family protein [Streptomyces pactum]|uniref:Acetoacetate decarboxylase family protein n=2 Tax=Streptomyces pactum TaxID=68249 RepID=A0ABS0NE35_9ACTN|nr:acetoacetate decarboxylase family protein [Streptomyces pactum]